MYICHYRLDIAHTGDSFCSRIPVSKRISFWNFKKRKISFFRGRPIFREYGGWLDNSPPKNKNNETKTLDFECSMPPLQWTLFYDLTAGDRSAFLKRNLLNLAPPTKRVLLDFALAGGMHVFSISTYAQYPDTWDNYPSFLETVSYCWYFLLFWGQGLDICRQFSDFRNSSVHINVNVFRYSEDTCQTLLGHGSQGNSIRT